MADIPNKTIHHDDLFTWYRMQQELQKLKANEMLLRKKIFDACFPNPKEGTNSYPLPDGWVLKGKHVVNRDVDLGAFQVLRDEFEKQGISPDDIVEFKPVLVKRSYNTLTAEQQKLFDQALIVKPGSPSLEIVKPKKRGKAGSK